MALILYSLVVLFHVVTLPVDSTPRRRALQQLDALGITSDPQVKALARNVLSAAAMTYVAAALASLAQLAYFALAFRNRNDLPGAPQTSRVSAAAGHPARGPGPVV